MCYEFHRVMGYEGPSHTTLFRYASGKVRRPNVITEPYVHQAIHKLTVELSQKQNRQRWDSSSSCVQVGGGSHTHALEKPVWTPGKLKKF